jgi:5-methyltetrahydrofolate--homocysteine methyltransferase
MDAGGPLVIIGEKLNSSNPLVREAMNTRDARFVHESARRQLAGGADALDVNTAQATNEREAMLWCVERLRERHPLLAISIDTKDLDIVRECIGIGGPFIINSVEAAQVPAYIDNLDRPGNGVIVQVGRKANALTPVSDIEKLVEAAVPLGGRWYYDLAVPAVAAYPGGPTRVLCEQYLLREFFGDVKAVAGLSNVGYGMPARRVLNRTFLAQLLPLDACILDPTDAELMDTIAAVDALYFDKAVEYCRRMK